MRYKISAVLASVLLAAFLGLATIVALGMGKAPDVAINKPAADFSLKDLLGQEVKLSDFKGKVVFLNFWATWCPPCREEMPFMQVLHEKLMNEKFAMIAVAIDKEGQSAVKPFIEKARYTFMVLLDPDRKVASQYQVAGIPITFIINKEGIIVEKIIGGRDWSEKTVVEKLRKMH